MAAEGQFTAWPGAASRRLPQRVKLTKGLGVVRMRTASPDFLKRLGSVRRIDPREVLERERVGGVEVTAKFDPARSVQWAVELEDLL